MPTKIYEISTIVKIAIFVFAKDLNVAVFMYRVPMCYFIYLCVICLCVTYVLYVPLLQAVYGVLSDLPMFRRAIEFRKYHAVPFNWPFFTGYVEVIESSFKMFSS